MRICRERPARERAAEQRDELAPPHGAYPKAKDHGRSIADLRAVRAGLAGKTRIARAQSTAYLSHLSSLFGPTYLVTLCATNAGVVGFESKVPSQHIPLEGRGDFLESSRIPATETISRLRCGARDTQFGSIRQMPARGHQSLSWGGKSPRFWADPEMIRWRRIEQHHCSLCAGLWLQRERLWWCHGQRA